MPLGSFDVWTVGATNGRSTPVGGSFERSTATAEGRPDSSTRKRTSSRFFVSRNFATTWRTDSGVAAR